MPALATLPIEGTHICRLEDAQLERLADLVAERVLAAQADVRPAAAVESKIGLMSAAEVALTLGVSRRYVYEHAEELGGVRVGVGAKPRLRFDLEAVKAAMHGPVAESKDEAAQPRSRHRTAAGRGTSRAPLLTELLGMEEAA
jgi:Zn-dependent peptidase ImmA (M78 family)